MRKTDVEFHAQGYGGGMVPAVNVKIRAGVEDVQLPMVLGSVGELDSTTNKVTNFRDLTTEPEFTLDWIRANLSDEEQELWWNAALEDAWEQLQEEANEIWPYSVKVYSEGRSGGWAIVDGLPDFDSWDAIELGRWERFATHARALADDVPRAAVWSIHANVFETE